MNINDVLHLQEKTWTQKGNGVNAVINTVHKATQGNYGWKQPVNITDLTGLKMDITFQTEYPDSLLTQAHEGKRAIWRLKWWKGRGGQNVSGYPEQQLNEAGQPESWQLPTESPQNQQQDVQQAPQPTNTNQPSYLQPNQGTNSPQDDQMRMPDTYAYPVTPETARRMARCVFIEAMLQNRQKPLLSYVTELVEFTMTGILTTLPDIQPQKCPTCGAEDATKCDCPPW